MYLINSDSAGQNTHLTKEGAGHLSLGRGGKGRIPTRGLLKIEWAEIKSLLINSEGQSAGKGRGYN